MSFINLGQTDKIDETTYTKNKSLNGRWIAEPIKVDMKDFIIVKSCEAVELLKLANPPGIMHSQCISVLSEVAVALCAVQRTDELPSVTRNRDQITDVLCCTTTRNSKAL